MSYTAVHDFQEHRKGDTFKGETFNMSEIVDGIGRPIDLTDCEIRMDFRSNQTSPIVLRLTSYVPAPPNPLYVNGLEIVDAVNGIWRIKPIIISLQPGTYMYDIEFKWPSTDPEVPDDIQTLVEGRWTIKQDTTHD